MQSVLVAITTRLVHERAIQYVYERYGRLGAAMTANVITYRGRSAAREVGKVLGFDDETLGHLSGLTADRRDLAASGQCGFGKSETR